MQIIVIPIPLEAAAVLTGTHKPHHIAHLCSEALLVCRLPATPSCLGIPVILKTAGASAALIHAHKFVWRKFIPVALETAGALAALIHAHKFAWSKFEQPKAGFSEFQDRNS